MKIAVCVPSRGLIHSRTIEAILKNELEYNDFKLFFTHDLPIPACFNKLVEKAKDWDADYIWFVEEDMVPDQDTLIDLMTAPGDVRACDYLIAWNGQPVTTYKGGHPIFTGMGCMLVPMGVLDEVGPFRTDICYDLENGDYVQKDWDPGYGGQDVHFCMRLRELGFILTVQGEVQHLRVKRLGEPDTNKGSHDIRPLTKA